MVHPSGITLNAHELKSVCEQHIHENGILHWDALTWSRVFPIPAPPRAGAGNDDLEDIWMVASQDGWAVGEDGLILRFGPIPGAVVITVPITVTSTNTEFVTSSVPIATTSITSTTTSLFTSTSTVATTTISTAITSTNTLTVQGTVTDVVTTVQATSTQVMVVTSTQTAQSPPVPGFPLESILVGLVAGVLALFVLHRRKGPRS